MSREFRGEELSARPEEAVDPRPKTFATAGPLVPLLDKLVTPQDLAQMERIVQETRQTPAISQDVTSGSAPAAGFFAQQSGKTLKDFEDVLRQAGRSPEEIKNAGKLFNASLPTLGAGIGKAAVPFLLSRLIPAARTATRVGGQIGGNIAGSAGINALSELFKPPAQRNVSEAALTGAAEGVLPGLVQGAGTGIFGGNRDALKLGKAMGAILGKTREVSEGVAKALSLSKPEALLSRSTLRMIRRAAGKTLDAIENDIAKELQGAKFTSFIPGSNIRTPIPSLTFEEIRNTIKSLRTINPEQRINGRLTDTARQSLASAAQIEKDLLSQIRAMGKPELAEKLTNGLSQFATDMDAFRFVQGLQRRNTILGGVNPQDRPSLAQAARALSSRVSPQAAAQGGVGGLELLTGRPVGASFQLGRFLSALRPSGPLNPRVGTHPLVAPSAASVAAALQALTESNNGPR